MLTVLLSVLGATSARTECLISALLKWQRHTPPGRFHSEAVSLPETEPAWGTRLYSELQKPHSELTTALDTPGRLFFKISL